MSSKGITVAVVVLVLAIGLPVTFQVLAVREKRQEEGQARSCTNNLKRLDSVVYNLCLELSLTNGADIGTNMVTERGWYLPACPSGGTYSGLRVGVKPSCSIHGILKWDPVRNGITALKIGEYVGTRFGAQKELCLAIMLVTGAKDEERVDVSDAVLGAERRFRGTPYVLDRQDLTQFAGREDGEAMWPFGPLLRQACTDTNEVVRRLAFGHLAGLNDPDAEALINELLTERRSEVVALAREVLAAIRGGKGKQYRETQYNYYRDHVDEYYRQRYSDARLAIAHVPPFSAYDSEVTGTWRVDARKGPSGSGEWRYTLGSNGVPATFCVEADMYAGEHKVTGIASVFYADTNVVYCQKEFKEGLADGECRLQYPYGVLRFLGRFSRGEPTGQWRWFSSAGRDAGTMDWEQIKGTAPSPTVAWRGGGGDETVDEYIEDIVTQGPPPASVILDSVVTNASVVGTWGDKVTTGLDWQVIRISASTDSTYAVTVDSYTDVGGRRYVSTNRATYVQGVLRLDRPVKTSRCRAFQDIYVVGSKEYPLLLPESELHGIEGTMRKEGEDTCRRQIGQVGLPRVK